MFKILVYKLTVCNVFTIVLAKFRRERFKLCFVADLMDGSLFPLKDFGPFDFVLYIDVAYAERASKKSHKNKAIINTFFCSHTKIVLCRPLEDFQIRFWLGLQRIETANRVLFRFIRRHAELHFLGILK